MGSLEESWDLASFRGVSKGSKMFFIFIIVVVVFVSFLLAWRAARKLELGIRKSDIDEGVLLSIQLPRENERLPIAAEQMFASLHGLLRFTPGVQEHLSLEMTSSTAGVHFYVYTPRQFKNFVESQIYAQYPDAEIREALDYTQSVGSGSNAAAAELTLAKEFLFPIKTFRDFEVDPLSAITSAIATQKPSEQAWIQILIRPVEDFWQERGHEYVGMVREGLSPVSVSPKDIMIDVGKHFVSIGANIFPYIARGPVPVEPPRGTPPPPRLSAGQELDLKMIENKLSKLGFEARVRIVVLGTSKEEAEHKLSSVVASFKQFSTASLNGFVLNPESPEPRTLLTAYQKRLFPENEAGDYILNIEELASIFHLPNISVETPTISWTRAKKGEPPLNLPTSQATIIGETIYRDVKINLVSKNQTAANTCILLVKLAPVRAL